MRKHINFIVDDDEIHRIADILSDDVTAIEKKEQIYGALGLPPSELEDLQTKIRIQHGSNSYSFFQNMLVTYRSRSGGSGTLKNLIDNLKELNLINVVGKHITLTIWFK